MISRSWMVADLGILSFQEAHQLQFDLVEARHSGHFDRDQLLLLEHPAVFTLGRRGGRENLMISETELKRLGIDLVPTERGGDITYHGPGQLVGYLLAVLDRDKMDIPHLVSNVEEVMIRTAMDFDLHAGRDPRNHGVWVDGRKLGSIGIAIRHGITFHGFALNVNNDLTPFKWINACGLAGVEVTSMSALAGRRFRMTEVKQRIVRNFEDIFDVRLEPVGGDDLKIRLGEKVECKNGAKLK